MALTFTLELESSSSASGGGFGGVGDVVDYSHSQSHGRRERMFEKVVTPSDVGKLNRLVVPKQFAERHLPLRGAAARARGTVLCFHDGRGGGAAWRFRYSYWSSSQSYVMTKGWNRYVRDKRLAAGDTVTFCRDGARLFIDCRRRKTRSGEGAVVPASAVVPAPAIVSVPPTCQKLQGLVVPAPAIVAVPPTCQQLQGLVVPAPAIVGVPPTCQQQQGLVVFPGHGQHKQQHQQADEVVAAVVEAAAETEEARRWLRLFGVNLLELRAEPVLLDLLL